MFAQGGLKVLGQLTKLEMGVAGSILSGAAKRVSLQHAFLVLLTVLILFGHPVWFLFETLKYSDVPYLYQLCRFEWSENLW